MWRPSETGQSKIQFSTFIFIQVCWATYFAIGPASTTWNVKKLKMSPPLCLCVFLSLSLIQYYYWVTNSKPHWKLNSSHPPELSFWVSFAQSITEQIQKSRWLHSRSFYGGCQPWLSPPPDSHPQPLTPHKQDREKIRRIGMRKLTDQVKVRKIVYKSLSQARQTWLQ